MATLMGIGLKKKIDVVSWTQAHYGGRTTYVHTQCYDYLDEYENRARNKTVWISTFFDRNQPSRIILKSSMKHIRRILVELERDPGIKTIHNEKYRTLTRSLDWMYIRFGIVPQCIDHRVKVLRLKDRNNYCNSTANIETACKFCGSYHKTHETVIKCQNRFKSCCADFRYKKYYARLMQLDIKSNKLMHSVIGFPHVPEYQRSHKLQMEKTIDLFLRTLKKQGIVFQGKKVFDVADESYPYVHFHMALLPMGKTHDLRKIQKIVRDVSTSTGTPFVYHYIGYRGKKKLFDYIAKRQAGLYGHGSKMVKYKRKNGTERIITYQFTPSDMLNVDDYISEFYNIRTLTNVSRRIACTVVPVSEWKCEFCDHHKQKVSIKIHYHPKSQKILGVP